jgi:aromatic ring-cleaving dioxygenase
MKGNKILGVDETVAEIEKWEKLFAYDEYSVIKEWIELRTRVLRHRIHELSKDQSVDNAVKIMCLENRIDEINSLHSKEKFQKCEIKKLREKI